MTDDTSNPQTPSTTLRSDSRKVGFDERIDSLTLTRSATRSTKASAIKGQLAKLRSHRSRSDRVCEKQRELPTAVKRWCQRTFK